MSTVFTENEKKNLNWLLSDIPINNQFRFKETTLKGDNPRQKLEILLDEKELSKSISEVWFE